MEQTDLELKYQQQSRYRALIKSTIRIAILLAILFYFPKLALKFYENQGYSFKDQVGFISKRHHDNYTTNPNQQVSFENEVVIDSAFVKVNESRYKGVFSSNKIFDVGMISDLLTLKMVHFYDVEFLYGHPFSSQNEVVLSESISMELFNTRDSVNEKIIIYDQEFTVSGVVKESIDSMQYIYFEESNFEAFTDSIYSYFKFIIFEDQDLHLKLYQRGGINLVQNTLTRTNQRTLDSTSKISISLAYSVIGILYSILESKANKASKNKQSVTREQGHVLVRLIKVYYITTSVLITLLIMYALVISNQVSFRVATLYLIDQVPRFYWALSVYLIPTLWIVIKEMKTNYRNQTIEGN